MAEKQETPEELSESVRMLVNSAWVQYNPKPIQATSNLKKLRVMTFNVWFDDFGRSQRALELFRLIKEVSPDVVCLQEVTPSFLKLLKLANCFQNGAVASDLEGSTLNGYGVVIISNNPDLIPEKFTMLRFPSMMGRSLVTAYFNVRGKRLAVATVHLESLYSPKIREKQLRISHQELSATSDTSLLMGDFNFDDKRNFDADTTPLENDTMTEVLQGWIDTWSHLKPDDDGKTFDTTVNKMLSHHKYERMRYDRVMIRSNDWNPTHIDLAGTEPFTELEGRGGKKVPVVISDHFGLVADFSTAHDDTDASEKTQFETLNLGSSPSCSVS